MPRCMKCMGEVKEEKKFCPFCGNELWHTSFLNGQLPEGTLLCGRYLLGKELLRDAQGITYIGWDVQEEGKIAVTEWFPKSVARREKDGHRIQFQMEDAEVVRALKRFLGNAGSQIGRNLPGLIGILDAFRENGTAYFVREYAEGNTVAQLLKRENPLPAKGAEELFEKMQKTVEAVHRNGVIHANLCPENVLLRSDGDICFLNRAFPSPAGYDTDSPFRAPTAAQGEEADTYSLYALYYRMLTGVEPVSAAQRLRGAHLPAPRELGIVLDARTEERLMQGLHLPTAAPDAKKEETRKPRERDETKEGTDMPPARHFASLTGGQGRQAAAVTAAAVLILVSALLTVSALSGELGWEKDGTEGLAVVETQGGGSREEDGGEESVGEGEETPEVLTARQELTQKVSSLMEQYSGWSWNLYVSEEKAGSEEQMLLCAADSGILERADEEESVEAYVLGEVFLAERAYENLISPDALWGYQEESDRQAVREEITAMLTQWDALDPETGRSYYEKILGRFQSDVMTPEENVTEYARSAGITAKWSDGSFFTTPQDGARLLNRLAQEAADSEEYQAIRDALQEGNDSLGLSFADTAGFEEEPEDCLEFGWTGDGMGYVSYVRTADGTVYQIGILCENNGGGENGEQALKEMAACIYESVPEA